MYIPLRHYLVEFDPPEEVSSGGIALPAPSYYRPSQGTIIGLPTVNRQDCRCPRGAVVLMPPAAVSWLDYPAQGFVRDEDLLAQVRYLAAHPEDPSFCSGCRGMVVIRNLGRCKRCGAGTGSGYYHLCRNCALLHSRCQRCEKKTGQWEVEPMEGWVGLQQDQDFDRSVGGTPVRETASGVLVACGEGVKGADTRLKRRGEELYRELLKLGDSPRFKEQPRYYQHRMVWDFLDGLTAEEYRILGEAIRQSGKTGWQEDLVHHYRGAGPKAGTVAATHPFSDFELGDRVVLDKEFRGYHAGGLLLVRESEVGAAVAADKAEEYSLVSIS